MASRHGGQNDTIGCASISDSRCGRQHLSQTCARAQKLVEKARATPHAAESEALLNKTAEILAKEGATLADLDAVLARGRAAGKMPRTAVACRPHRSKTPAAAGDAPVVVSGLIDEIGSMSGVREATISVYNAFLDNLQAELGQTLIYVSTLLFDQSEGRPLVRPSRLGSPSPRPRASRQLPTALTA